jgi:hypothetical protein
MPSERGSSDGLGNSKTVGNTGLSCEYKGRVKEFLDTSPFRSL